MSISQFVFVFKKVLSAVTVFAVTFLLLSGLAFPSSVSADTTPPTITSTFPTTGSSSVPIESMVHVNFSENVNPATITPSNITFTKTSDSSAVAFSLRVFPNGFDVVPSAPAQYTASSRWAKLFSTQSGFYNIPGSGAINIQALPGGYTSPTNRDIVFFQHESFPMELGLVTNNTETAGSFEVNGFDLFGGQEIVKFATPTTNDAVTGTLALNAGDIVVANTTLNPTSTRYSWHLVTTAAAVNSTDLRLDSSSSNPTFVSSSVLSVISPTDTSAVNASSQIVGTGGGGINFAQGDMIFAKVTANADNLNAYAWHIVTTGENFSSDVAPSALRLDSKDAAPTFAASTRVSLKTPSAQGAVSASSPTLAKGDIIFASLTAGGSNLNAYNFHMVSGAGAPNAAALRFDNAPSALTVGTGYTLTIGTGVTDTAGNALAAQQTVLFTTGSTGGTNTTPSFVTSSSPQTGAQSFPTAASIKLVFSQDMSTTGGTSGANSVTNPSNTPLTLESFGGQGATVTATRSYDSATKTLTIDPSASLTANTGYVALVLPSALSATGTPAQQFTLGFRTASGVDTTKPKVLGVFPSPGASSVALPVSDISIGFSEDMDASTINTTNITISPVVTGTVTYDGMSRTAHFSPSAGLSTSTTYTLTVGTAVTDLSGNALEGNGGVANAANTTSGVASTYVFSFGTSGTADTAKPFISSANADNFSIAVTFSEALKTGAGPNAADNIANYALESPVGSTVSLSGKTVTWDGSKQTATITGLALQNSAAFKVTANTALQDLANNLIDTTGSPALNIAQGVVLNATTTGGQLGPGSGATQDPGVFAITPIRVTPMNKAAGATSSYMVEFPVATSIPLGGKIVLTFPTGFDVTNAAASTAVTESFRNSDINGPLSGTVTIASLAVNVTARTITITTGGAATGTNAFLMFDLKSIVNTTVPSTAGYTVDVKTKDASGVQLESLTSASFFLGPAGSNTLTVNVFNDNGAVGGTANNNTKDGGESGIQSATVFLFSPAIGGQNTTTNSSGVATFSSLPSGTDYMLGIEPSSVAGSDFTANTAPQPISITANTEKNFGLRASTLFIQGTVTGPANTSIDVFATTSTGAGGFVMRNYSKGA